MLKSLELLEEKNESLEDINQTCLKMLMKKNNDRLEVEFDIAAHTQKNKTYEEVMTMFHN